MAPLLNIEGSRLGILTAGKIELPPMADAGSANAKTMGKQTIKTKSSLCGTQQISHPISWGLLSSDAMHGAASPPHFREGILQDFCHWKAYQLLDNHIKSIGFSGHLREAFSWPAQRPMDDFAHPVTICALFPLPNHADKCTSAGFQKAGFQDRTPSHAPALRVSFFSFYLFQLYQSYEVSHH